jgi:hypothetical protein
VRADAPERLEQIVLKALEKDRDERYQTAADLRADLRRLKREIETEPSPVGEIVAAGDGNRARAGISEEARGTPQRHSFSAYEAGGANLFRAANVDVIGRAPHRDA